LQKTKPWLMEQVLAGQQGHPPLTPSLLQELQSALASTALFGSYELQVMPATPTCRGPGTTDICSRDLVIRVQERDYGSFELAPGFRNDLGVRLEAKFIYGNLFGLNQSFLLESTINQRITDSNIAPARQSMDRLLEYNLKSGYTYPYFLKSTWDYGAQLSIARVRYFNFDADIDTLGNTFTRRFGEQLDFSLQQQLENVEQFSGLAALDNGRFRVGSLTPALTYDGRDNAVNTKKGHWWNFSLERASPALLSSNSDRYEIDYFKFTARSRLYIPLHSQWTLACSVATGVQKNLQQDPMTEIRSGDPSDLKRGFIPPIKLFRLNGIDLVRGFAEEEINRLPTGEDISSVLIQDRVYMTVVKLEPRYQWSDQLQLGFFVDAGRLQRDHYDPTDLRSSAGLSIKYLTPVGTLDLDYGHKLLRKRYPNGTLDDPGRIHLSIGFF
jgi:outer membrane protein insertion porin family